MGNTIRVVMNKSDLKKAYEDKADEIIIIGDFAKKVKKAKAVRNMSQKKLAILGAALVAVGGGVAMSPTTLGTSAAISFTAAAGAAAKTGVSVSVIIAVSSIGLALLTAVFKDYDYIEAKKGDFRVVLKKRKKK